MAHIRMSVNRLRKGMILGNSVFSRSGVILVTEGTEVTKDVVDLLTKHFIDSVVVEYQTEIPIPQCKPKPHISEEQLKEFKETFQVAEQTLSDKFKEIASNNNDVDVQGMLGMLNSIVDKSGDNVNLCDMLSHMKQNAESLYTHSINVALFGQVLGQWMKMEKYELEFIAVAGLLHDIGLLQYMKDGSTGIRFEDEMKRGRYEKHVVQGYNMIKDKELDVRIKQAVLTHHERLDGSGFPLKIAVANINRISRVIAIADAYDTLTMKEEGKKPLSTFAAVKILEDTGHHKYDSQMLLTFVSRLINDSIQHEVRLNTGETGRIVMINKFNLTRPLIRTEDGFIDLSLRTDLDIAEVLD